MQSDMTAGGNTVEEEMWSIGNHSSSTGELRQLIRHIFGTRSEDDGKLGFGDTEANWCTAGFFCPDTVLPRYLTFLLRSLSPLRDGICGELACLSCSIHQPPSRRMTETDDLFCQLLKDMRIQLCTVGGVATQLHINSRRGKVQLPAVIAAYHELSALLEEATSLNATEQEFSTWTVCDPSQPKLWLQSSQYNITFDDILIYLTTIVDFLNAMAAMKDAAQYIHCKTRRLDDTVSSIMNIDSALYPSLYLPLAGRICLMSMDHINNDDLSQPWLYSCQEQREFQNMATSLLHVNKSMQRQDWLLNTWEDVCPSQSKQNSTPPAMDSHVATPHDHQLASDIAEICKTERPEIEACPEFGQAATYMPHEESHYLCFDTTCPYPAAIARSRPREDKPFSFIEEVHSSLRAYFNTSHLAISNQSNHLWSCHLHCKYSTQTLACVSELSVLLVIRNIGLWMGVLAFALSVWFVYKRKKLHRLHMPDQLLLVNNTLIIVSHTTVLIAMVLHRTHIGCRHDNTIVRGHREIGLLCASSALNSATVLQLQVVTWCMLAHSWKHLVKQVRNCVQGLAETVKSSYRHRLYYLLTAYTTFITSLLVVMAYAPQGIRVDNVVKLCKFIDRHPLLLIPKVLMIAVGCVWLYKGWRIFYITVNSNKRDLQQERSYRAHFCNQRPVLQYLVTDFLYLLIMVMDAWQLVCVQSLSDATLANSTYP